MSAAIPNVCVIGSGVDPYADLAVPVGELLARLDVNLLTGGGAGVMKAVSQAFVDARPRRGVSVGVLPCGNGGPDSLPPHYPNAFVQVVIRTHLADRGRKGDLATSRNHINVLSADVIIALPGSYGTESELRLALRYDRPTIIFAGDYAIPQFPHEIPRASSIEEVEAFVRRAIARG